MDCNELTHHRQTTDSLVDAATDGSTAKCWAVKRGQMHI